MFYANLAAANYGRHILNLLLCRSFALFLKDRLYHQDASRETQTLRLQFWFDILCVLQKQHYDRADAIQGRSQSWGELPEAELNILFCLLS